MRMTKRCIVTIGREYGSGGREIGEKLAEKLGISFYDRHFLEMASLETGYRAQAPQEMHASEIT